MKAIHDPIRLRAPCNLALRRGETLTGGTDDRNTDEVRQVDASSACNSHVRWRLTFAISERETAGDSPL